jgi:alpha-beta hydrolase superfamily lysophospholipase
MKPSLRTLRNTLLALAVMAVLLITLAWLLAKPATPGSFYERPPPQGSEPLSPQPGRLLRQEVFAQGIPPQAQAWRILYTTTDTYGAPALASAIVMHARSRAPDGPASNGPQPVVAWLHGTTGVEAGCAPSLLGEPLANVPGLTGLLARGWVMVATDYMGQGTAGPHPYLIGPGQARSALDAVRAAHQMQGLRLAPRTVVWGHSQGGHAALWTGIVAPAYAPELTLVGVAAAAPASDLLPLLERAQHTPIGRIMSAYVLQSYSATYPDVSFAAYTRGPITQRLAQDMASRCLAGSPALLSVGQALLVGRSIFGRPPVEGPLAERLAQNTPNHPLPQPLLLAQGLSDELVLPEVQSQWVQRRCTQGQALEYRRYPGHDHLSLVADGGEFSRDLLAWSEARFADQAAANDCPAR